ncbi:Fe-S cluster assembly protein SufD [Jatrophihabitans endophyticus]|uniref:Fe-S cluster assembly protein SufD n=1 Tax=Jatrophihabitans endophyticus TaxID=1206085 RepID=A0A1M5N2K0_9ACTN|nr:Fe-S cluster assembly protein SufD [Jatrophihabitans endophyticus]SHG83399.1 Fe-S cluster assembly protein SufD [Jatrophihabitans endophyticus]
MTALLKPTGSPAERFTSRDPQDFPDPSTAQEDWRFSPLAKLREFFEPFEPDGEIVGDERVPEGAHVEVVDPRTLTAFGTALEPVDRPSALAMAHASRGLHVTVDKEAELAAPIVLTRTGVRGKSYTHHVVEIGAHAKATVVLDHRGLIQVAANIEFIVGDGAQLDVVSVNDADEGSIQLSAYAALVGRDATYRMVNVTLGGSVVRVVPTVRYAGPGGHAELLGVSFAGDGQHFETRLFVDHAQPNCTSDVLYKNALLGESARTVWIGDVRIRPSATGTDTYEMNRNLLLSDGARADSVPNLEIETGDIAGAGHASATGRFDDLQLFYLQSRGIPEDEARRLVVRGFFADVIDRIGVPDLQRQLMTSIEARLGFTPELESESNDNE